MNKYRNESNFQLCKTFVYLKVFFGGHSLQASSLG